MEAQQKILRTVEYGTFERVGSSNHIEVDARIVGATNADLRTRVDEGTFMPDLLDRLSFEVLVLPPLRERNDDIPLLANHFAARMAMELEWAGMPEIEDEAMEILLKYDWPGNIRELKNVIERAVYCSNDMIISPHELVFDPFANYGKPCEEEGPPGAEEEREKADSNGATPFVPGEQTFADAVSDYEISILRTALEHSKFNQRKAADALGLTYHQFRGIYRKYQEHLAE
jgi:psp operon transcriptional activator